MKRRAIFLGISAAFLRVPGGRKTYTYDLVKPVKEITANRF